MTATIVFLGQRVSWLEGLAFVTGLWCVWLVRRMNIWNWPIGLINVACFGVLFVQARLYADAALQVAFAVLNAYGWWQWSRAARRGPQGPSLPVTRSNPVEAALWLAGSALAVALGAAQLARFTDSPAPVADTAILVLSLLATIAQALRRLESWWLWIVVDVVSIPLYWSRALPLTALLYAIFLLICIAGLRDWQVRWQAQRRAREGTA